MKSFFKKILYRVMFFDLVVVYLCFFLGYLLNMPFEHTGWASVRRYLPIAVFFGPFFLFIFRSMGLYKEKMGILHIKESVAIFRSVFYGAMITGLFLFLIPEYTYFRQPILFSMLFMLLIVPQERLVMRKLAQRMRTKGVDVRKLLIVGTGGIARNLAEVVQKNPKLGFRFYGFVSMSQNDMSGKADEPVICCIDGMDNVIKEKGIDAIFLAETSINYEKMLYLMRFCEERKILFRFVPYLYNFSIDQLAIDDLEGIPLINFKKYNPHAIYSITKRVIDLVVSGALIVVLSPVLLILAIFVKTDSGGGVLFSQKRIGQNGKVFRILKFRTMHRKSAKYDFAPRDSSDSRVTRIGRFLRKTSLDELPQIINVLRGDMSIVGPRPEMPFIVREYNEIHKERLKVKPGITGLWQISEHRKKNHIHENMEYDLYYIENQSFLLDLAILLRTAATVLNARGK